jgi:feruloyl esterase
MRPLAFLIATAGVPAVAASCDSLAGLALPNTQITSAAEVGAGQFVPPAGAQGKGGKAANYGALPAFCRVAATLKPTPHSEIRIEVSLPLEGWNGNFQAVGNGGWAGKPQLSRYGYSGYRPLRHGEH